MIKALATTSQREEMANTETEIKFIHPTHHAYPNKSFKPSTSDQVQAEPDSGN